MTMTVPARCFTCGAVIGQHWDDDPGANEPWRARGAVLDALG